VSFWSPITSPHFIMMMKMLDNSVSLFKLNLSGLFPVAQNLAVLYRSELERKRGNSIVVRAINQVFVYASFNCNLYSVITTQHELHCFKRIGDSTLTVSDAIPLKGVRYQDTEISFFTCWLFILFNAKEDGMYTSCDGSPTGILFPIPKSIVSLNQVKSPIQKLYSLRRIKADDIFFEKNPIIRKGAVGSVISGKLYNIEMKFKLYDVFHDANYMKCIKKEVYTYKKLESLQGSVIPNFHGVFHYGGIVLIALEDCGLPLMKKEYDTFHKVIGKGIAKMEALGVVHDDLVPRDGMYPNILKKKDEIRIIDFHL